jgi:pyruvate dehydrogenase E1 component
VRLLGSGTILREVEAAADLLSADFGVDASVYSVTSFTELARDGMEAERWNRLHPVQDARVPYVASVLGDGPAVAATDYVRAFAESIRPYVPGRYSVLGTDGYGRSDWRRTLRAFFEVDRRHVAVAALKALADDGAIEPSVVQDAIDRYELDVEVESPWRR